MLTRRPQTEPEPDPDDLMIGQCQCCKTKVEVRRSAARPPEQETQVSRSNGAFFTSCWSVECPSCRAKTARVIGTDGRVDQSEAGPPIYLMKKG